MITTIVQIAYFAIFLLLTVIYAIIVPSVRSIVVVFVVLGQMIVELLVSFYFYSTLQIYIKNVIAILIIQQSSSNTRVQIRQVQNDPEEFKVQNQSNYSLLNINRQTIGIDPVTGNAYVATQNLRVVAST